jgi:hypothetical protein
MQVCRVTLLIVPLAWLAACSSDTGASDPPLPPPPSQNPIDVAIWPRLVASGLTALPAASPDELCRRMALDLTGVTPAPGECDGKTPEEMARAFMATPRFIAIEKRFWIRRLGADPMAMMADHIADADTIYEAAASGDIGYDDLVARLTAHPIITINRPVAAGDDVTQTVQRIFTVFLGRMPSAAEVADYANLLRPWRRRFEDRYDKGYGYYVRMAAIDPAACRDPVLGKAACTSTLLGPATTVDPQVTAHVPAGYSQTSSSLYYYELDQGNVPAALEAELEKPGRLLAMRAELWDEAADLALARFLGWWRSSANVPETVLPEVRRALAESFRARTPHDLRELYVTVLTSLLYTTSNDSGGAANLPPWATGPSKLLEPEQMLDTLAHGLGRDLGLCDPHTDEPVGRNFYWPDRLRTPQPTDFYGFGYDFYLERAQQLGGCSGAIAPPRSPGLPALLTHIDLARDLCRAPGKLLPDGVDPQATTADAMAAVADHLFAGLVGRRIADDERPAITAAATACAADTTCHDASGFGVELCGALLRSAAFLYP